MTFKPHLNCPGKKTCHLSPLKIRNLDFTVYIKTKNKTFVENNIIFISKSILIGKNQLNLFENDYCF